MSKKKATPVKATGPTFEDLVRSIREVDRDLSARAKRAVNVGLTLRNWLIGCDIVEYEQRGADRAELWREAAGRTVGPPGPGRRQPGRGA